GGRASRPDRAPDPRPAAAGSRPVEAADTRDTPDERGAWMHMAARRRGRKNRTVKTIRRGRPNTPQSGNADVPDRFYWPPGREWRARSGLRDQVGNRGSWSRFRAAAPRLQRVPAIRQGRRKKAGPRGKLRNDLPANGRERRVAPTWSAAADLTVPARVMRRRPAGFHPALD